MPCTGLRFLVVEDHPVQRKVTVLLLQRLGAAQVHAAADGAEALEILKDPSRPVDIVLSDLEMPRMDASELVRQLATAAASRPWSCTLILLSSTAPERLAAVAHMSRAYSANVLGVIAKPASATKIVPLVEAYRRQRARLEQESFGREEILKACRDGEFEPAWSARVAMETAEVVGVHATPCWQHPHRGLLPDEAFMADVERFGLLDEFAGVLLRACARQAAQWQREGLGLQVALSLSLTDWATAGTATRVVGILRAEGVDPRRMVLGVSARGVQGGAEEHAAMKVYGNAGCQLAIEDYTPLGPWDRILARSVPAELWIGRNLISGVRSDESVHAGLVVALDAAHQHGLVTVGRGIALLDDWNRLQEWGCEYGEGPFISQPMAGAEVSAWLAEVGKHAQGRGAVGRALQLGVAPPPPPESED